MKRICVYVVLVALLCSGCNKWMEVLPKQEQVTPNFWKSKEDVEAVLGASYLRLRNSVSTLINWGELRAGSVYAFSGLNLRKLQNFQTTPLDDISDWATLYEVIGMANSVIKYAPDVLQKDETYLDIVMESHLTEAYFLRALAHFYLVRNFKDVPIVTEPYVDDSAPFDIGKSMEREVIEQIKGDIRTALGSGAAKGFFDIPDWPGASKGRATKWALYALMVDVCLWSEDYLTCTAYADSLIHATEARRPAFMTVREQWFEMFYPGNSNESIFEINWSGEGGLGQTDGSPSGIFSTAADATYQYSQSMAERLYAETEQGSVRAEWGAYVDLLNTGRREFRVWKYLGMGFSDPAAIRPFMDANWIVYRMADIMLMKAEALIWQGQSNYAEALALMNQVRVRAGLPELALFPESAEEEEMLNALFNERDMELAAEGKRWYDLLRFARTANNKYKAQVIDMIVEENETGNEQWIRSVLANDYAWYLPILEDELIANPLLTQNPYYGGTTN